MRLVAFWFGSEVITEKAVPATFDCISSSQLPNHKLVRDRFIFTASSPHD